MDVHTLTVVDIVFFALNMMACLVNVYLAHFNSNNAKENLINARTNERIVKKLIDFKNQTTDGSIV